MDPDFSLVIGLVLIGLSIPSILSSISDRRAPRFPALIVLIGGGLVLYAMVTKPSGYALSDLPDVFMRVFANLIP